MDKNGTALKISASISNLFEWTDFEHLSIPDEVGQKLLGISLISAPNFDPKICRISPTFFSVLSLEFELEKSFQIPCDHLRFSRLFIGEQYLWISIDSTPILYGIRKPTDANENWGEFFAFDLDRAQEGDRVLLEDSAEIALAERMSDSAVFELNSSMSESIQIEAPFEDGMQVVESKGVVWVNDDKSLYAISLEKKASVRFGDVLALLKLDEMLSINISLLSLLLVGDCLTVIVRVLSDRKSRNASGLSATSKMSASFIGQFSDIGQPGMKVILFNEVFENIFYDLSFRS